MKGLCEQAFLAASCIVALSWLAAAHAETQNADTARRLVGEWRLNADLSDKAPDRSQDRGQGTEGQGRRAGGGSGGGGRRGGYGGGFGGGRFGGGASGNTMSPDDRQRMRDALHDIMTAPDRLTITEGDSMVIITSGEGHVDRLSPNGKKIKDESTGIERKTKWDGDKLVSEISGAGSRKITQTYSVDPERKQLHIVVQMENAGQPTTLNRVYDTAAAGG